MLPARSYYAVLVGRSNGDGAWRGLVTIVEVIDPRPYIFQVAVYGNLDLRVHCNLYERPSIDSCNPNPRLPLPPDLRSTMSFNSRNGGSECVG